MLGVGFIILLSFAVSGGFARRNVRTSIVRRQVREHEIDTARSRRRRKSFVEKTIRSLLNVLQHALFAEEMAKSPGLLQRLDARVKLVGIGLLIVAAVALHQISVLAVLLTAAILLGARLADSHSCSCHEGLDCRSRIYRRHRAAGDFPHAWRSESFAYRYWTGRYRRKGCAAPLS